jgi:DNA-binding beta-propeller fold protein YncE
MDEKDEACLLPVVYFRAMGETVYGELEPEVPGQPQEPEPPPLPTWGQKLREPVWIGAIITALVLIATVIWWNRPQPPPPVLGASNRSIAISSDGKLLLVGTFDGALRLVSTETGRTAAQAQLPGRIQCVAFGPNQTALVLLANDNHMYILSDLLASREEREVQANARDLVWSPALDEAVVVGGGRDDIHPSLEFFPEQPLGIANSTSQLVDLTAWSTPMHVAASGDGSRVAVTLNTNRRGNVLLYDTVKKRVAAADAVTGRPGAIAVSHDGTLIWVVSPDAEAVSEIRARSIAKADYPKSASTSPLLMLAVNEATHRAYTTGSLTFPEVDLEHSVIARTLELPTQSAGIALSPDGNTAYLTFKDRNAIGVANLQDMHSYREIELH